MTGPGARGWAVLCDFDGTATTEDIGDQVAQRFGRPGAWLAAEEAYAAGAIGFGELIRRIFGTVTARPEEIAAFAVERAELRHGLERFLAGAAAAGRPVTICSAGLDVYIEPVLARLPAPLRRGLALRCNAATCSPEGMAVAFHGGGALDCGSCGFCKGRAARLLQAEGWRVALVGDGAADRCAADAADAVFARRSLVPYCRERGIPFRPFESFDEVAAAFAGGDPRP